MINRVKSAMNNVMGNLGAISGEVDSGTSRRKRELRHPYGRPDFLKLNEEEIQVSADHTSRPILVPREIRRLPWCAGYAEVINAGKTKLNEDQARAGLFYLKTPGLGEDGDFSDMITDLSHFKKKVQELDINFDIDALERDPLPFTYFAIFDGHAGTGAALMAVNMLHNIIKERLCDVRELLLIRHFALEELVGEKGGKTSPQLLDKSDLITADSLIVGAIESSFFEMDEIIAKERLGYQISGGCTALVAIFFLGKLYVANAGDCRAILVRGEKSIITMSQDFTPITERQRIQNLGEQHPHLLHGDFTPLEFVRRVTRRDLGKQLLCRDGRMKGWTYKTITEEDLKFPLVYGDGKRARVLATIGVTRGFGDHDLKVYDTEILIKPFLTCEPDIRIYDMSGHRHSEDDVLIMGSDGLWDVLSNSRAAEIVRKSLYDFDKHDVQRYTSAAQELIINARGLLKKGWKTADNRQGSGDDITAFVIPLHCYSGHSVSESSSTESALHSNGAAKRKAGQSSDVIGGGGDSVKITASDLNSNNVELKKGEDSPTGSNKIVESNSAANASARKNATSNNTARNNTTRSGAAATDTVVDNMSSMDTEEGFVDVAEDASLQLDFAADDDEEVVNGDDLAGASKEIDQSATLA